MSILIKGAKMPTNCKACGFAVCDDEYSPEYWCPIVRDSVDNYVNCRHKLCPLVEIPPHGRLIDADKLKDKINIAFLSEIGKVIDDAPTVIESEEERC